MTRIDHSNCTHSATKKARARCRREADRATSLFNNYRIINGDDPAALDALDSALENGVALHPTDQDLAHAEAVNQFEGWLANGREW